jgi:hypothetical protein
MAYKEKGPAHEAIVNVSELNAACNILTNGEGTDPVAKRGATALRDILLATAHPPYKVVVEKEVLKPVVRLHLPTNRNAINHKFTIDKTRCYIIVGLYPDGKPGEVFLKVDKTGSMEHGMSDAFSCLFSLALQYGIPLKVLVNKFKHVSFAPAGITDSQSKDLRFADSIIDYVVRWMEMKFLLGNGHVGQKPVKEKDQEQESLTECPHGHRVTDPRYPGIAGSCLICRGSLP